jgi:hypothetical protein
MQSSGEDEAQAVKKLLLLLGCGAMFVANIVEGIRQRGGGLTLK